MNAAELIEEHRTLVYAIAHEQHRRLGGELDELVGDGMVALVETACRYDETRGVSFAAFARHRVRGAMIDGYRRRRGPLGMQLLLTLDGRVPDVRHSRSAEDQAVDRLALGRILEMVAEMATPLRDVVDVVLAGGTFRSLAEKDGVTEGAIGHRWATAVRWMEHGRPESGRYAKPAVACNAGHAMSGDNVLVERSGRRRCRICWRRSWARARERRRAS